jgi:hypothetical protein
MTISHSCLLEALPNETGDLKNVVYYTPWHGPGTDLPDLPQR